MLNAVVVYRNNNGNTVFADAHSENGQNWTVSKEHLSLSNTRMQMEALKNAVNDTVGIVLNVKKGAAQRLYLWHDGKFQAPDID